MSLRRDFYAPSESLGPGRVGSEDCDSLFTHLKTKRMIPDENLTRHFLRIQKAVGQGELENAYGLPEVENPVEGLTNVRSDMVPLLL